MRLVLIVDDERSARRDIRTKIQTSGIPVEGILECESGEAALEILQEQDIDVVFTDIRMPGMGGVELVERMQELASVPMVAAVSGCDDFSCAIRLMRSGVREYILKPAEQEDIRRVMQRFESELEKRERAKKRIESMELQQIRYLLMQEQSGAESSGAGIKIEMLPDPFVVAVLERRPLTAERENVILLEENNSYTNLIAAPGELEYMLKNELRGSYVGISAVHSGAAQFPEAYREAVAARKQAFGFCLHKVELNKIAARWPAEAVA